MRRKRGTGLVHNELKVLAAALLIYCRDGSDRPYGYELFTLLKTWEGEAPMDYGTLYRCLRSLERFGMFTSESDPTGDRLRVWYRLTEQGLQAAQRATIQLAALDEPPVWIDISVATKLPPFPAR
ncbi:MAG: PadR family transcriptional regulator [Acidimicrobiia bacterium]